MLKAAGLLDEESTRQDEFVDGEGDQPNSDSEHEHGRGNENFSEMADWGDTDQPRHAPTGQKSGSMPTGNFGRNSCLPLGPRRSSMQRERRHSATGCSDLLHVPVLRADDREESRYYGLFTITLPYRG